MTSRYRLYATSIWAFVLLVGCGGNATGRGLRVSDGDASAGEAEVGALACKTELSGAGPFAMRLAGLAYPEGLPNARAFAIFFPDGREAGRKGFLVDEWTDPDRPDVAQMVADEFGIDVDLGAEVEIDSGRKDSDLTMKGLLVGPSDGVEADFSTINHGTSGDAQEVEWHDKLCPTSEAAKVKLVSDGSYGSYGPNSTLTFSASGPIDSASVSARITATGLNIPVATEFVDLGRAIRLSPRSGRAFPPNQPVEVDWTGTTDVVGRDVRPYQGTAPLMTTSVVSDRTFSIDPPFGSIAVSWSEVPRLITQTDGAINLAPVGLEAPWGWAFYTWLTALVALPAPDMSTHARLKASTSGGCAVRFAISDSSGIAADIAATGYDPATIDDAVEIPGAGPQWLSIYAERTLDHTKPPSDWCAILVDEVAFE